MGTVLSTVFFEDTSGNSTNDRGQVMVVAVAGQKWQHTTAGQWRRDDSGYGSRAGAAG